MRIYQAGPLFSEADQEWHKKTKARLTAAGYDVVWPGELVSGQDLAAWGADAPQKIMEVDLNALRSCDVVLALLDGAQVDDGTAFEVGYAYAREMSILGIRTDFRQAGDTHFSAVNAMIEGACVAICKTVDEVIRRLDDIRRAQER